MGIIHKRYRARGILIVSIASIVAVIIAANLATWPKGEPIRSSPLFLRIEHAIIQPSFLRPKIRTVSAYPIASSYSRQPLAVMLATIEQGRVTDLVIQDTISAGLTQGHLLKVLARLHDGEGMILAAVTNIAAREAADELQRVAKEYNAAHSTHVRILLTIQ